MRSQTSVRSTRKRGFLARWLTFDSPLVIRLSSATTSQPSAISRSQRCDPRKPVPPVITARMSPPDVFVSLGSPCRYKFIPRGRRFPVPNDARFFFTAKRYTVAALVYPELRRVTRAGFRHRFSSPTTTCQHLCPHSEWHQLRFYRPLEKPKPLPLLPRLSVRSNFGHVRQLPPFERRHGIVEKQRPCF